MKKINFTTIKVLLFLEDVDIKNVLVFSKISPGEKNHKYFIGYLYDDYKVKPLHKQGHMYRFMMDKLNQTFSTEDDSFLEKYNTI